jgi:phosphoribosylglycinamide formyltransferase 1
MGIISENAARDFEKASSRSHRVGILHRCRLLRLALRKLEQTAIAADNGAPAQAQASSKDPGAVKNLGILLSGRGSNFEAIAANVAAGRIPARIAVVVSNREEAPGLARARGLGLETRCLPSRGKERDAYDREMLAVLEEFHVDLVCLAGFMRLLGPTLVRAFPDRILNIHPALLPAFPGMEAQKQALEHGVKFSGCTVHLVDEGVDSGPIVLQAVVPVLDDDTVETLSARILKEEHRIYSEAIRLVLEDRIRVEGRRALLKG